MIIGETTGSIGGHLPKQTYKRSAAYGITILFDQTERNRGIREETTVMYKMMVYTDLFTLQSISNTSKIKPGNCSKLIIA